MRSRWLGLGAAVLAAAGIGVWTSALGSSSADAVHAYRSEGVVVVTVAGLPVNPGQSEAFDTYIVNDTGHPVRVTGAKVATVPGQRKPRLSHVALVHSRNIIGVQNWPPTNVQLLPLVGDTLPTGRSDIAVGISSQTPGLYAVAGVTLTLRDGSQTFHATAYGGGIACVVPDKSKRQLAGCRKPTARASDVVTNYIHQQ